MGSPKRSITLDEPCLEKKRSTPATTFELEQVERGDLAGRRAGRTMDSYPLEKRPRLTTLGNKGQVSSYPF